MDAISGHSSLMPLWVYLRSRLCQACFGTHWVCSAYLRYRSRKDTKHIGLLLTAIIVFRLEPFPIWQGHDPGYIICIKKWILTRTSVIVCLPTSIKSASASPRMHNNLLSIHRTRFLLWNAFVHCWHHGITLRDRTPAGAIPWATKSCTTQPAALVVSWWLVLLLCVLPNIYLDASQRFYLANSAAPWCLCLQKVAQMCTDSPYHHSTSSSGDAICIDGHCQWQRSWMVHVQCGLHEQHSHSWSGTSSWQPAWGAGWPDQVLS